MTDPLSLLRHYNVKRKEVVEKGMNIIFGDIYWPKNVRTNFLKYGTGQRGSRKEYYSLGSVLFFLKNVSLTHLEYAQRASAENIPVVHRFDRPDLEAYLKEEIDSCSSIDSSAPFKVPSKLKRSKTDASPKVVAKKPNLEDTLLVQRVEQQPAVRLDAPREAAVNNDDIKSPSSPMPDPLSLLRQYCMEEKEIVEKNDQIIFGEYSWPKNVRTNYLEYGSGTLGTPKKYYTLETLLFCLKCRSFSIVDYLLEAQVNDVPFMYKVDRQDLLAYLSGRKATSSSIDESAPVENPTRVVGLPTFTEPPSLLQLNSVNEKENKYLFCVKEYARIKKAAERDFAGASQQKRIVPPRGTYVTNADGHQRLLYGLHSFTKDKVTGNRIYWKCDFDVLFHCPARITTRNGYIESEWRAHNHWKSPTSRMTETNSISASASETTRNDTENVNNSSVTNAEVIVDSVHDVNCSNAVLSETTRQDTENVNSSSDTNSGNVKANTRETDCLSTTQSETRKVDENVHSLSETNSGTTKANTRDIDCSSTIQSETRKVDENVNSLSDINSGTTKANIRDIDCSSTTQSETEKVNSLHDAHEEIVEGNAQAAQFSPATTSECTVEGTENVMAMSGANTETVNTTKNARDAHPSAAKWKIRGEPAEDVDALMSTVSKLFDKMGSKIVDGAKDFQAEELSMIWTIYSLYERLMILRKFNGALDNVISDLRVAHASENHPSSEGSVDLSTESSETSAAKVATPSKQLHSATEMSRSGSEPEAADVSMAVEGATEDVSIESNESAADDSSMPNLSEKVTCVCMLCNKPIDVPPDKDIRFFMEAHLCSQHPTHLYPVDSAGDDGDDYDDDSESDESQLSGDATTLLDGTKVDDFEVKFDSKNALKYIMHSNGICMIKEDSYSCLVCGLYMPLEKHVRTHLTLRSHRERAHEYARNSSQVKRNHVVAVNPDVFVIRDGKLFCVECRRYFGDPHSLLSHVSERHEQRLKLDFSIRAVGGVEFCLLCDERIKDGRQALKHLATNSHYFEYLKRATVVQLRSVKFCSLCGAKLFTESQFNAHVNHESHLEKFQLLADIVDAVKFASKSK